MIYLIHTGLIERITGIYQNNEDPVTEVLDLVGTIGIIDESALRDDPNKLKIICATLLSLSKTLDSIKIHGQTLNSLVDQVRRGNDKALFKAVKIDRSSVSCPTIADRIARAEFEQDKSFFRQLRNALTGPPQKPFVRYYPLRVVLELFDEAGLLDELSMEEQYNLFCVEHDLYPTKTKDPAKNLNQFIYRWKKDRST